MGCIQVLANKGQFWRIARNGVKMQRRSASRPMQSLESRNCGNTVTLDCPAGPIPRDHSGAGTPSWRRHEQVPDNQSIADG